ncbi:MAG: hypothetical protein KJ955_05250 [Nanoarchaeota archaeon]|nr:hypothetical protein [Nanoarchaeota archaeon]
MEKQELMRLVQLYLKKAKIESRDYPLDEVGFYKIHGGCAVGTLGCGRHEIPSIFHGKFVDAVAFAVQHPLFYACWVTDDPSLLANGYLTKVDVCDTTNPGLLEVILDNLQTKQ